MWAYHSLLTKIGLWVKINAKESLQRFSLFLQRFKPCLLCDQSRYSPSVYSSKSNKKGLVALCTACFKELPWLARGCYQCAMPLPHTVETIQYCGECLKKPPYFDRVIAPFYYAHPINKIIKTVKFGHGFYCTPFLREALLQQVKQAYGSEALPQILIPLPLHAQRLRERGFNQALEITRKLAKELSIPMDIKNCVREKNSLPQTLLDAKSRRKQSISWKIAPNFCFHHVAIVDDVMTTGATVNSLAKALRAHGIEKVDIWVCARTVNR